MDIININAQITEQLNDLNKARKTLLLRAEDKAKALGEYEKKLAQTMLRLRQDQPVELDGEQVSFSSATGLEKIAKGVVYKESIALDLAQSKYKNAIVTIEAIKAIVNGLQSQLKYME